MDGKHEFTRRQFLRLSGIGAGAILLAACQPEAKQATSVVEKIVKETVIITQEKEVEKVVTATPVAAPAVEKIEAPQVQPAPTSRVRLTMWDGWGRTVYFGREPIQEAVDAWNTANPTVTCEYLPGLTEMTPKLLTSVASGDPPNVVIVGPTTQLAYRGVLTKLDDYLALGNHEFDQDDIYPGSWESMTVGGSIYSIAWNTNNGCLFYNTDMFEAAGLDPEQPPRTIDELTQYADQLTIKEGANITQLGFVPWFNIAGIFGTWASAFGAQLWNETERKVQFDDPKSIESLQWQATFAEKLGYDAIAAFNDSLAGQDPLGAGRLAILFTGPWMINLYRSDYPSINWRTAPPPVAPGGPEGGTWLGGRWVAMPTGVKDPEMTWEFVKYFAGRAPQRLYGVLTTNFSVFPADNDNEWFNRDEQLKVFIDDLPNCWPIPEIPTVDHAFFTALNPMIEQALRGNRTPAEAMQEATQIAQEEVDRFFQSLGS